MVRCYHHIWMCPIKLVMWPNFCLGRVCVWSPVSIPTGNWCFRGFAYSASSAALEVEAVSFENVFGRCLFRISTETLVILRVSFHSLSRHISSQYLDRVTNTALQARSNLSFTIHRTNERLAVSSLKHKNNLMSLLFVCLFVFLSLQPIVVVFSTAR
jgi:hypothetical protein